MISRFRVSAILPRRLDELGLSLPAVLRQANLPIGLFNQEKILVTTEELFALYRGIAEVSRDPAIGLKLGSEQRLEAIVQRLSRRFTPDRSVMRSSDWRATSS